MGAAFAAAMDVEERAKAAARPLLAAWCHPGVPLIDTHRARRPDWWQRTAGDYLAVLKDGALVSIEVKGEERWTGNFFAEYWSNRDFGWQKVSWAFDGAFDVLAVVYLDRMAAVVLPFPRLWAWLFLEGHMHRAMDRWETAPRVVRAGRQANLATGTPIPFADLLPAVGGSVYRLTGDEWRKCDLTDLPGD